LRGSKDYLGEDYARRARSLYEKYHPIEINQNIPLKKRKKAMEEWWRAHFKLLIESGLNKKHLARLVKSPMIKFRKGAFEFFDTLYFNKIPLVIMSASGLGGDTIAAVLKKAGKLYPNVHIVSNSFSWNKKGRAISIKKPIIHTLNKDEAVLKDFPFYEKIKNRKNVLLLGDNLEDIEMITGFNYRRLIKIGFLNKNVRENSKQYEKFFDVLILSDSSMECVNFLLKEIIKS
jgi:HAD superfamily hydrolase (TIGR01544 family)